jgi:hypothetical protein
MSVIGLMTKDRLACKLPRNVESSEGPARLDMTDAGKGKLVAIERSAVRG